MKPDLKRSAKMKPLLLIAITILISGCAARTTNLHIYRPENNGRKNIQSIAFVVDEVPNDLNDTKNKRVASLATTGGDFKNIRIASGLYDCRVETIEPAYPDEPLGYSEWTRIQIGNESDLYFIIIPKTSKDGYLKEWELISVPSPREWEKKK